MKVAAFPGLLCDHLLCFVVDVIHWGFKRLPILKVEGSEHAGVAHVVLVKVQVLVLAQVELGFPDGLGFHVRHIVVVGDAVFAFGTVADAHQQELILPHLPHGGDGNFRLVHALRLAHFVGKFVLVELTGPISNFIGSKLKAIIMSSLVPAHHGVVVGLPDHVFVGPGFF